MWVLELLEMNSSLQLCVVFILYTIYILLRHISTQIIPEKWRLGAVVWWEQLTLWQDYRDFGRWFGVVKSWQNPFSQKIWCSTTDIVNKMRGELKVRRYRQEDKYLLHRNILDFLGSRILTYMITWKCNDNRWKYIEN